MAYPMPPPRGQQPPPTETRGPMLIQATWIMIGISTPFVVARVCARLRQMKKLGWDDYLMVLSLLFSIITGVLTTEAVRHGFGRHMEHIPPEDVKEGMKMAFIVAPFAFMALVFGRVSFAVSLIVLIGTVKWRRWLLYFVIASQFVVNLLLIGVGFGQCNPVQKYWDRSLSGTCLPPVIHRTLGYAQGGFNIFADLVLAIMPAIVISNLQLKSKVKFGLVILMSLGLFNMVAAIVTVEQLSRVTKIKDKTYEFVIVDIWGLIQTHLVIVIASIPFLRPLFTGKDCFSWGYYRSLLARYSQRSQSNSDRDRRGSSHTDDTLCEDQNDGEKAFQSLSRIHRSKIAATTLGHAGMETETQTGFDHMSYLEAGRAPAKQ